MGKFFYRLYSVDGVNAIEFSVIAFGEGNAYLQLVNILGEETAKRCERIL